VNFGIAAWLATFLVRTYGWTPAGAGIVQGILTMTVGVAGTLAGGRVADVLDRRGRDDAPLRVGIIGAIGMLVSASAYPLMPTAALAVAWLVIVNFFAALPWGPASAAAAEIVPASIRTQGAALYFFVLSLVSGTLGPTAAFAPPGRPALFRRPTALLMRHAARARVPLSAPRATLLVAASGLLVHRRPGAAFGLLSADAATLVAFLDVLRHPLLLARVFRFVAAWHRWPLRMGRAPTRAIRIPSS